MTGLVLYGPPTAGKDTIGAALRRLDDRFRPVPKVKSGTGRSAGYRMVDAGVFENMRVSGRLAGVSERYGNRYGVDRHDVRQIVDAGCHPVVHSGRLTDMERLVTELGGTWLAVLLWCDRDTTTRRSLERGDTDSPARLAVWECTRAELLADPCRSSRAFDFAVRTDRTRVSSAARLIAERMLVPVGGGEPAGRRAVARVLGGI